jgi:hypothetical protein
MYLIYIFHSSKLTAVNFFSFSVTVSSPVTAGNRVRSTFPCSLCGKRFHRHDRHIMSSHSKEPSVMPIFAVTDTKHKRLALTKLKSRDTFLFNCEVLAKREGELIVARRFQVKRPASDYLPCTFCLNFFVSEEIWRHARTCQFNVDQRKYTGKRIDFQ